LKGEAAKELAANAEELFSEIKIHQLQIVAQK
jgi:hypothetical protein